MSEEYVNLVATSGEHDKNEADSFNVTALIAEAREWPRDGVNEGRLINALADALEAAVSDTPSSEREREALKKAALEEWQAGGVLRQYSEFYTSFEDGFDAGVRLAASPAPARDEWCREEDCQYRHWRSGSVPTHRRGEGCPLPVTEEG